MNIMAFCKEYNAATAKMAGDIIPVEITVYEVRRHYYRIRCIAIPDRPGLQYLVGLANVGFSIGASSQGQSLASIVGIH